MTDEAEVSAGGTAVAETAEEAAARRAWFRQQVLPLEPQLRQYVRRILPAGTEVDDVVHETFIRVISLAGWRQVKTPIAFLKTVARNLVNDLLRHRNVIPIHYLADMETTNVSDEMANPERTVVGRDELRYLAELVERLPPQCRKVFTLRKVHGLPNEAIAKQLGLTVSTIEKHLVKALRICSEGLARREDGPDRWQEK